eukprot:GHVP01059158.1.p1 GENE.GHVP01059158.1~~GHVP01059158.1.p1  ORF type:complete len:189 (-),score=41.08 GHVP01059158.1:7-573(-)
MVDTSTKVETTANVFIVVEKDAVYQQLLETGITSDGKIVLLTGKGFPDFTTRKLLRLISNLHPEASFYYFGDWDPSGIQIYMTYSQGAKSYESEFCTCSSLQWLGLSSKDSLFPNLPNSVFIPLTARDKKLIGSLQKRLCESTSLEILRKELSEMSKQNKKCEMEALSCFGSSSLESYIKEKIGKLEF